jgi:hypothetical protein
MPGQESEDVTIRTPHNSVLELVKLIMIGANAASMDDPNVMNLHFTGPLIAYQVQPRSSSMNPQSSASLTSRQATEYLQGLFKRKHLQHFSANFEHERRVGRLTMAVLVGKYT